MNLKGAIDREIAGFSYRSFSMQVHQTLICLHIFGENTNCIAH